MNITVCLGLAILEISKTVMFTVWYGFMKPKYGKERGIMLHGDR